MKLISRGITAFAIALAALPSVAHHSFAMFDSTRTVTLEGTVKRFQWTNPHSWIYLTVTDTNGQPVEWAIEHGSPSGLVKSGWTPKTLSPGMKVKMQVHPLKDGNPGGQFLTVTLPDGKQLSSQREPSPAE